MRSGIVFGEEIWPPGGQISNPNTIPECIGPMIIYTKFEKNQMKTVGGVVFLVKS